MWGLRKSTKASHQLFSAKEAQLFRPKGVRLEPSTTPQDGKKVSFKNAVEVRVYILSKDEKKCKQGCEKRWSFGRRRRQ